VDGVLGKAAAATLLVRDRAMLSSGHLGHGPVALFVWIWTVVFAVHVHTEQ
jgi:hypothetical protein